MEKNFDEWSEKKKKIHASVFPGFCNEREIWWCSIGLNIGDEQDGKNDEFERPVLVVKKFNRDIVLTIPLTSKTKAGNYYFSALEENRSYTFILSQLRLISTKRMTRKILKINKNLFREIKLKLAAVNFGTL